MEDRALEHVTDVFNGLRAMVKDVDSPEEINDIVDNLFGYVGGKIFRKSARYGPDMVLSAIEFEGEVDSYTILELIRINDIQFGLNTLVEDLTMACWRTKLNRKDLSTYELINKIITT